VKIAQQLCTDSSIVLNWIQGPLTNWKIFVGNSVAIIQEETSTEIWRLVPTQSNPADIISRGNRAFNNPTIYATVEGTTQVITGAVKLAYNRSQQH